MGSSASISFGFRLTNASILDALGVKTDYPATLEKIREEKRFCPNTGKPLSSTKVGTPTLPTYQRVVIEIDGECYADVTRITDPSYVVPKRPVWGEGDSPEWGAHIRVLDAIYTQTYDCRGFFECFELFEELCDSTWGAERGNDGYWLAFVKPQKVEDDGSIKLKYILAQKTEYDALRSKLEALGFENLEFVFQPIFNE